MNMEGKKVLVVGTGISGIGAVCLLAKNGAYPILFDENEKLQKTEIRAKFPVEIEVELYLGSLPVEVKKEISLVILSPGVPADTEFAESFRKKDIPVWGELELAYRFGKGRVIAITGTNGKTTTTALTGQIIKDYFKHVFIVGNIGNSYTLAAMEMKEDSITVAEVSSFQLETTELFYPKVSAILNITPDHLNRHHTMDCYTQIKESITKNQTKDDVCVLNYEDPVLQEFGKNCPASVVYFSSHTKLENGYYLEADMIYRANNQKHEALMNIHEMKLLGIHNVENVMAAIAITASFGVPMERILHTVKEFRAVEHRIEYVATKNGVDYYNDSKGTNTDAAIKGIQAMNKPTILIGGGYDKQSEYDEWIESFDGKVKWLVLLGQTKEKIAECARKHGFEQIIFAETLEEVVDICASKAVAGDAVLLSPACASWGMFPNYEVRGKMFKELVMNIKE